MDISKILPLLMTMNNGGDNKNNMLNSILPELLKSNGSNNQAPMNNMLLNMLSNNFFNNTNQPNLNTQNGSKGVATPYPQNNYATPFANNFVNTTATNEPPSASNFPPHVDINQNQTNNSTQNNPYNNVYPSSNLNSNLNNTNDVKSDCPLNEKSLNNQNQTDNVNPQPSEQQNNNFIQPTQTKKEDNNPPTSSAFGYNRVY